MDESVEKPTARPKTPSNPKGSLLSPFVTNGIAVSVTIIWSVSFVADILVKTYDPPGAIHVAFMVILGGVFGLQIFNGRGDQ